MRDTYDVIGRTYATRRQADPRLAGRIAAEIGDTTTVRNVGAGTGSYEPVRAEVVAVEPSAVMIAQRSCTAAPSVRAYAEALPFSDGAFDVVLAVFTVHHWDDQRRGLDVQPLPIPGDCVDGFLGAFWQRPDAYLDQGVREGISSFGRLSSVEGQLARLRRDLVSGQWERQYGALRGRESLDIGYRLVVTDRSKRGAPSA